MHDSRREGRSDASRRDGHRRAVSLVSLLALVAAACGGMKSGSPGLAGRVADTSATIVKQTAHSVAVSESGQTGGSVKISRAVMVTTILALAVAGAALGGIAAVAGTKTTRVTVTEVE